MPTVPGSNPLCYMRHDLIRGKQSQVKIDEDAGIETPQPAPVKLVALLLCFSLPKSLISALLDLPDNELS